MDSKLICPVCEMEGKANIQGFCCGDFKCRTFMGNHYFYDDNKNYHCHNDNTLRTELSCKYGHKWQLVQRELACKVTECEYANLISRNVVCPQPNKD